MLDDYDRLHFGRMEDYIEYNKYLDNHPDILRFTEANKYDLKAMERWVSIRDRLTFIKDYEDGDWRILPITTTRTKYGCNYVYIDVKNKKWRTYETGGEFYGDRPPLLRPDEI